MGSDVDFHHALNAAIRSTERHTAARETRERSKKLKREADGLIKTSRELLDASKSRILKHERPSTTTTPRA